MDYKVTYPHQRELPDWLLEKTEGNTTLAKLFYRRGITTPAEWEEFLDLDSYQPTKPLEFKNLQQTRNFIRNRINSGAKICVYGDYDADGIISTAILAAVLRQLGADVVYHIPDRFTEGYGLDEEVIAELAEAGVELIVTCDCGISNFEEVAQAKDLGLEIVVTDHHQLPPELPPADYILSPKLLPEEHRAYDLPGAGMAYMLARALLEQDGQPAQADKFLELLALAIVADVVPLQQENRYLLREGLDLLATPSWPGVAALCAVCDLEPFNVGAEEIGFQLAPRLNAAGRISTARKGVELLLAAEEDRAEKLARELDEINNRRKEISSQMEEEAWEQLAEEDLEEPIVLYNPDWHQGVVGIVAGRLTEQFQVPALLLSAAEEPGVVTGSARSIEGVHMYQGLTECSDLLLTFGGHAGAAGFSLRAEDVEEFITEVKQVLAQQMTDLSGTRELIVDDRIGFDQLSFDFYEQTRKLAPFGEQNPEPVFYSSGVEVVSYRSFSEGKHINLVVSSGGEEYTAVWWRGTEEKLGKEVDLVYTLTINHWRGRRELQLVIERVLTGRGAVTRPEINFVLEDWRNWQSRGEVLSEFFRAVYYYEGLEEPTTNNLINRYQSQQADNLVFLSCPPELNIAREIINKVMPDRIILAYSQAELRSPQHFLNQLAGLTKHIINQQQGETDIYQLAALTAEQEVTVLVGLKCLQAKGLIQIELLPKGSILVNRGTKEINQKETNDLQPRLTSLLAESRSFKKYMLQSSLQKVRQLLG